MIFFILFSFLLFIFNKYTIIFFKMSEQKEIEETDKKIKNEEGNKIEIKEGIDLEVKLDNENENEKNEKNKGLVELKEKIMNKIPEMKNENYIEQTGNKSIDLYVNKINHYKKVYFFTEQFTDTLIQLFNRLIDPFFSKIRYSYFNEIKPVLKYYKDISLVYYNISTEMSKLNENEKTFENQKESIIGEDAANILAKTNNTINDSIRRISYRIKKNILSNPLFAKMDTIPIRFDTYLKKTKSTISDLEKKKKDYINSYNHNYEKQFDLFKNQIKSPDLNTKIQDIIDLVLVEHILITASNQMYVNFNHFLNEMKVLINNVKDLLNEYIELLRQCTEIYHNQMTIFFDDALYKTIGDFDKFIEGSTKVAISEKLSAYNLLEKNVSFNTLKEYNDLLSFFQNLLIKYFDFIGNNEINNKENFKAEKYTSLNQLIDFIITLLPKKININYNDLIVYSKNCKRSAGMFKGFRNSYIVITIQGHILIFDEEKEKNEDIIANKLFFVYNKAKVEISERKNKKNNFLISICEVNNKKRTKNLIIDTLSEENLKETIKNIGELVERKDDEKNTEEEEENQNEEVKNEEVKNEEVKKEEMKKEEIKNE